MTSQELVEAILKNHRLNQQELAQRLDVNSAQISRILSGQLKMSLTLRQRIVQTMGYDPAWLLMIDTSWDGRYKHRE